MGRALVLHLCDPGSKPMVGSYFFFLFFFCLSRISDNRPVRICTLELIIIKSMQVLF